MNQPKRPAAPAGKAAPGERKVPPRGAKATPKSSVPPRGGKRPAGNRPKPAPSSPGRGPSASSATPGAGSGPAWERRAQRRKFRNRATVASIAVVAVVAVLVVVKVASGSGSAKSTAAPPAVVAQVTNVDLATLVTAAHDTPAASASGPGVIPGGPVSGVPPVGGKPSILYVGAEYCPYCAAERWPIVMALSKFGQFTNLGSTTSSSSDKNPNTPTFSFVGSTYTSPYLSFTGVETQDRKGGKLQTLSAEQAKLLKKFDAQPYVAAASEGSIPFVLLGGQYLISGASYDANALADKSLSRVSDILSGTSAGEASGSTLGSVSQDAKAVAGRLVGAICSLTGDQPAGVCSQVPADLKQGGTATSGKGSR